jgi:diadenosine tetraphosphatase ApaH/serine/threonine PP2A family protein phosphatase
LRLAVLSDIHGNYDALQAVLEALEKEAIDAYACLGDIVGYGPQPCECLHEIQRRGSFVIAGNHDYAVTERIGMDTFNSLAKDAILWTKAQLSAEDLQFLASLPLVEKADGAELVHGSLYAPELFDYVQTSYDAYLSMSRMKANLCFLGHSHVPVTFIQRDYIQYSFGTLVEIPADSKVLVNVGSIGQPRDKDPRACFAVYDSVERTVAIRRIAYDIDAVVTKIRKAGLPASLGERLRVGR